MVRCKYAVLALDDLRAPDLAAHLRAVLLGALRAAVRAGVRRRRGARATRSRRRSPAPSRPSCASASRSSARPFDSRALWTTAWQATYGAEIRPERPGAADGALREQRRALRAGDGARGSGAAVAGDDRRRGRTAAFPRRRCRRAQRRRPLRAWRLRRLQAKGLFLLRILRNALIFEGGVDYVLWKIQRHSGVAIDQAWRAETPSIAGARRRGVAALPGPRLSLDGSDQRPVAGREPLRDVFDAGPFVCHTTVALCSPPGDLSASGSTGSIQGRGLKGIILSAGQGRRLLPLTTDLPKCLLRIGGRTVLEWQLRMLAAAGVHHVVVVVGFGAAEVERQLADITPPGMQVRTLFNELYDRADNLVSCAVASPEMGEDFLLLNGDTLADSTVVDAPAGEPGDAGRDGGGAQGRVRRRRHEGELRRWPGHPGREGSRRRTRPTARRSASRSTAAAGPELFTQALDEILREPEGSRRWYLSAVNLLAGRGQVHAVGVEGARWAEIDYLHDLPRARALVASLAEQPALAAARPWARSERLGVAGGAVAARGAPRRQRSVGRAVRNGYVVTEGPSPHVQRARELIKRHPEVRRFFGPYPLSALYVAGLVAFQIAIAYWLRDASWLWVILAAYLVGAFASHALFVLIHDASHNLIVEGKLGNRLLGILCNVGQGFPSAMSFRTYHLLHHSHLDEYDFDADLAFHWEARLVGNSPLRKALWLLLFAAIEIIRPLRIQRPFAEPWVVANVIAIAATDLLIW